MHLFADLASIAKSRLAELGYGPGRNDSDENLVLRFHNVMRRLPPKIKWDVRISDEASNARLPPKEKAGFEDLISRARGGSSLRPRMHEHISRADFRDLLLNCWGLHHFHLGPMIGGSEFAGRTDLVAYAHLDVENAIMYVVAIDSHGDGMLKQRLLAVVEDNWPDLADSWSMKGIPPSTNHTDRELTARVERTSINVPVQTPGGRVILSPGGGISATKKSFADVGALFAIQRRLEAVERDFRRKRASYETRLGLPRGSFLPKLIEYGDTIVIQDKRSGKTIQFR